MIKQTKALKTTFEFILMVLMMILFILIFMRMFGVLEHRECQDIENRIMLNQCKQQECEALKMKHQRLCAAHRVRF